MNDFTREELKEIFRCVNYMITGRPTPCRLTQYDKYTLMLKKKVHSMINNYCDHTEIVLSLYGRNTDIPIAGHCCECGNPVDEKFINE